MELTLDDRVIALGLDVERFAKIGLSVVTSVAQFALPGAGTIIDVLREVRRQCGNAKQSAHICNVVCERLEKIMDKLVAMEEAQTMPTPDTLARYAVVLQEFHDLLQKHQRKNFVLRIVSFGKLNEKIGMIQSEIDHLFRLLNLAFVGEMMDMKRQYVCDQELQQQCHDRVLNNFTSIMDELHTQRAQLEAVMMLKFEVEKRPERHTPEQIELMKKTFCKIVSVSQMKVGAIPPWFISPDDIDYSPVPFNRGAFGAAHRGKWGPGTRIVVKTLLVDAADKDEEAVDNFMREISLWHQLNHPHVIKMYGACHVSSPPFIVCEDAVFGNLSDYLANPANRCMTWQLLHQAALGLGYLQEREVVHGDLKCNNILVGADGMARVSDFGMSFVRSHLRRRKSSAAAALRGSVRWKAPEYLRGEASTPQSDVYSFAMTIIEAVTGDLPWGMMADEEIRGAVMTDGCLPERPTDFPDKAWALIENMCHSDPAERASLVQVIDMLAKLAATTTSPVFRPMPSNDEYLQCTSCDFTNSSNASFCGGCAASLPRPGAHENTTEDSDEIDLLLATLQSEDVALKRSARLYINRETRAVALTIATTKRTFALTELLNSAPEDEDKVIAARLLSAVILTCEDVTGFRVNQELLHQWLRSNNTTSTPVEARQQLAKCLRSIPESQMKPHVEDNQVIELLIEALERERDETTLGHLMASLKQLTVGEPFVVQKLVRAGGLRTLLYLQLRGENAVALNANTTLRFIVQTKAGKEAVARSRQQLSALEIRKLIEGLSGTRAHSAASELLRSMQRYPDTVANVVMFGGVAGYMNYLQLNDHDAETATAALALLTIASPSKTAILTVNEKYSVQLAKMLETDNERVLGNVKAIFANLP